MAETAPQPTQPKTSSGLAIAGLVLGIIAILTSFLPIINNLSFFVALIGLVLAVIALVGAIRGKHTAKGMSIAGVVLAVVSIAVVLVTQSAYSAALKSASEELSSSSEPVASSSASDSSDGSDSSKKSDEESAEKSEEAADETEEEVDYTHMKVGDSVTLGSGLTICLNSVKTGLVNYDDSLVTCVNVTYSNGGEKNESFNPYDWKGEDANGAQRSMDYFSDATDELSSGTLSPGGSVTGNIYFEDGTVRVLYYDNMFDNSETIGWDIA